MQPLVLVECGDCPDYVIEVGKLVDIMATYYIGRTHEQIYCDVDRDFWVTASLAVEYGMVDRILKKQE